LIVSEKKLENARMELEIEVPETSIEIEYEKVFNDFQKNAKID
jgi:FKBP-type peptidyl-prolyl cis-trans isomerase (trigger factor)